MANRWFARSETVSGSALMTSFCNASTLDVNRAKLPAAGILRLRTFRVIFAWYGQISGEIDYLSTDNPSNSAKDRECYHHA